MSETKRLTEKLSEYLQQQRIWYSYEIIPKVTALEIRLAKAQSWKDNQLERLKDFYDTYHEIEGSQEYYDLKELEKALGGDSPSCTKGEVKE